MSVVHCKAQANDIVMHFAAQAQGLVKVTFFASYLHRDLQFQSNVLEVLNRVVTLGFAVARLLRNHRFCDRSQLESRFWKECVRVGMIKIIPSARNSYYF